jgi:hypothetical protein
LSAPVAPSGEPNLLYYGDNLDVLRRHVRDESVDLMYLRRGQCAQGQRAVALPLFADAEYGEPEPEPED